MPGAFSPGSVNRALDRASRWFSIYGGAAAEGKPTLLGLAASVSAEFARLVTGELECSFSAGPRTAFVGGQLSPFLSSLRIYTEYACACGGVMFKPVFNGSCISVSCVLPGAFVPDAAGGSGEIVSARFYDHAVSGGCDYVREEKHTMLPDGCLIENRVWQGRVPKDIMSALPPSSVPAWSGIAPSVFIKGLKTPLFSYFCMPGGVADDPYSPLGASVFSKVVPLINEADRQFSRLVWEFEGGELAVDASDDVFLPGRDGKPVLPEGKERLFRPNALDSLSSPALPLSTFSPALRDVSIINGLNRMIMFIEDGVGLACGTLSDPNVSALTATEIRTSRQRTYVTVRDIQQSLGSALRGLCDACSALCDLYSIGPSGVCLPTFSFGDSVLADSLTERSADLEEVSAGVRTRDEYRSKWRIAPDGT